MHLPTFAFSETVETESIFETAMRPLGDLCAKGNRWTRHQSMQVSGKDSIAHAYSATYTSAAHIRARTPTHTRTSTHIHTHARTHARTHTHAHTQSPAHALKMLTCPLSSQSTGGGRPQGCTSVDAMTGCASRQRVGQLACTQRTHRIHKIAQATQATQT